MVDSCLLSRLASQNYLAHVTLDEELSRNAIYFEGRAMPSMARLPSTTSTAMVPTGAEGKPRQAMQANAKNATMLQTAKMDNVGGSQAVLAANMALVAPPQTAVVSGTFKLFFVSVRYF